MVSPQAQVNAAVGGPFAQQVGATPEEDKVPLAVMAAANATPLRPQVRDVSALLCVQATCHAEDRSAHEETNVRVAFACFDKLLM